MAEVAESAAAGGKTKDAGKPGDFVACASCGDKFVRAKMSEKIRKMIVVSAEVMNTCAPCRSRRTARDFVYNKGEVANV